MSHCMNCGARFPEGMAHCEKCGSPASNTGAQRPDNRPAEEYDTYMEESAEERRQFQPAKTAPRPQRGDPPSRGESRHAVMGTWNFVGTIVLMSIPVLGWIFCIAYACSRDINKNKRNLARAYLFFLFIAAVLAVVIYFAVEPTVRELWPKAMEYLSRQ